MSGSSPSIFDWLMLGLLSGLLLRWLIFLGCALADHSRQRRRDGAIAGWTGDDAPSVSVIIPAFNEERVIEATIRSAAASDLPGIEILVVDDGSSDDTAARVEALLDVVPGLVFCRLSENRGKARALNAGIAAAKGEVLATVDADTLLAPDTLRLLVATLQTTGASAVASNVKVGNRGSWLTRWQSLEYVTGLNIDRRAQCLLGIISTVPGAAAIWRRDAVEAVGGFPPGTFAEDTDLTLSLLRAGHQIEYQDRAVSRTEAPRDLGGLFRQRLRWLHGNLQCAWKHSAALWSPAPWSVRLMALPNLWFAHLGIYLLLPVSLIYVLALRSGVPLRALGIVVATLFALDVITALVAYLLDREDVFDLLHAPTQRLGYPLLLWSVFATVSWRLVRGIPMSWYKPERTGAMGEGGS